MIPIKCMAATGPMLRGIGPRSMPTGICGRPAEQWFLMQDSGFADVLLCVIGYCNEHARNLRTRCRVPLEGRRRRPDMRHVRRCFGIFRRRV